MKQPMRLSFMQQRRKTFEGEVAHAAKRADFTHRRPRDPQRLHTTIHNGMVQLILRSQPGPSTVPRLGQ